MKKVELLSPVGDFECLKAAVQNGANSVYLGASSFSARAKATNFNNTELIEAIKYAKLRNVSVHLALNTLLKNDEFEEAVKLAIDSYNAGVDAIIVQDLGFAKFLLKHYPEIPLHASTQMTVHNLDGVKQLENLGFSRVVLSRELSINEIEYIRKNTSIELEVFVHGALCISYSGQCLLSSMIGDRSGNRGLCAQPCRLPYELIDLNNNVLDKGYLLSPRDNCAIEYLPELIKLGIDSFKIEGRMKTPTYVGIVTRIYRKYIDFILENIELDNDDLRKMIKEKLNQKNPETNLSDKEELAQVFNRGGFETGHFSPAPNKRLIFKDKPNNMGIYLGEVLHFNPNKGHIKLKLESNLSIGDKISINNDSYTVSELMIDNKNFETQTKGTTVKIGRMKGNIKNGTKIYRIESAKLNKSILPSFKEDKNLRKILLNAKITIQKNKPITLKIWSDKGFFEGLEYSITSTIVPEPSINRPISKEDIIKQISKTGATQFEFKNIDIDLDDNLFIPKISMLNDLRRNALTGLENLVLKEHTHSITFEEALKYGSYEENSNNDVSSNTSNRSYETNEESLTDLKITKPISLLLNILDKNFDYTKLENINKLYIPFRYFLKSDYIDLIKRLSDKFKTYIYMPHVFKDRINSNTEENYLFSILKDIINNFKIKGFVVSHISQLEILEKFGLELIGNFNLNIYNNYSVNELKNMEIKTITLSPELDKNELLNVFNNSKFSSELIVYGRTPVMTNAYCYLGKSNRCHKECDKKCELNKNFYLKDRKDFNFLILPDNTSTITTIYNSKITSIKYSDIPASSIRIDITDEKSSDIQNIIDTVLNGERFEGKSFTNGKL